ncbi:MAG: nuclear transport factor 2 family protein [Cellulophaga sp.]
MKKIILSIITITVLFGCNLNKTDAKQNSEHDINLSALEVVNKRMEFYNLHDFEKFIQLYNNDIKIYTYPNKLLGTGTDNITSIFEPKFTSKSIQVQIVSQINNGNYVINQEIVTENGIDTKYVSIYEVENGLIKSVKFVRDN